MSLNKTMLLQLPFLAPTMTLDTENALKPLVSLALKEYCGLLASFHYSGQCYNPFYTTKNALCVRCNLCVSASVCGM